MENRKFKVGDRVVYNLSEHSKKWGIGTIKEIRDVSAIVEFNGSSVWNCLIECLELAEEVERPMAKGGVIKDMVNHPNHYTVGGIETIDFIQAKLSPEAFEGYLAGNILKYMTRYNHKNGVEDLKKAQWYLNKLVGVKE